MSSHRDTKDSSNEEFGGTRLGIDSGSLVAALRNELVMFKMELVPAFLSKTPRTSMRREPILTIADWQSATDNLLNVLQGDAIRSDLTDLSLIDSQGLSRRLTTNNGQAWWGSEPLLPFEIMSKYCPLFSILDLEGSITDHENVGVLVPEIKSWMVGLPIRSLVLHNSLSLVLPLLVDHDLEFVLNATTAGFWRDRLSSDESVVGTSCPRCPDESEEPKSPVLSRLACSRAQHYLDGLSFSHVLNNALLHVVTAMAHNHLKSIWRLLDHPNLQGEYTGLMLSNIFEILQAKCVITAKHRS